MDGFSAKSFWAWNELDDLVGAVWAIREGKYDNQGLGFMPKGFCVIGDKTVFFDKNAAQYIEKKRMGRLSLSSLIEIGLNVIGETMIQVK